MWYAGIDWSDQHHDVVVIDADGRKGAARRFAHSAEGLADLTAFLRAQAPSLDQLACIIETTQGLLIAALLEAGLAVYPVNPKTVDRRRSAAGAKSDPIDAYLLAKTGRSDLIDLRRLRPDSALIAELKTLTRDQTALIESQTRLVNQLTACLKAYYPVAVEFFTKLQQPSTLQFLRTYPTPEAAREASLEQLTQTLKTVGHTRAEAVARAIRQRLQQPHLTADPITTRTKARLMLALVAQLQPLLAQIAAYDQEIERLFLMHADSQLFSSLPGAAKRLAPRLLAEWGDDRTRYTDCGSVQALAGTAPVAYQSGTYAKAHTRYACVKPLRNALQQFAWQSTKLEGWARAYYSRKRSEGKSHSMAVRCLANVWVRIIFALWQSERPYQTAVFEAAQQQHRRKAA
jgi:transposase